MRNYVRYGVGKFWQFHQRRIYSELDNFIDLEKEEGPFKILHEFTFHYSDTYELFFVIAIMGVEYSINLGGPEIDTYLEELRKNNNNSFLKADHEKKVTTGNTPLF